MKFLLYGINFAPEPTGIGKYTGEMAAWLAAQGHPRHTGAGRASPPALKATVARRPEHGRTAQCRGAARRTCNGLPGPGSLPQQQVWRSLIAPAGALFLTAAPLNGSLVCPSPFV